MSGGDSVKHKVSIDVCLILCCVLFTFVVHQTSFQHQAHKRSVNCPNWEVLFESARYMELQESAPVRWVPIVVATQITHVTLVTGSAPQEN